MAENVSITEEEDIVTVTVEIGPGSHDVQAIERTTLTRVDLGLIPNKVHYSDMYNSSTEDGRHINENVVKELRDRGETVILPPTP